MSVEAGRPLSWPPGMVTGILAGLGAGAFWGMTFVAPLIVEGFSSVDYTVGRFVACGLFSALLLLLGHAHRAAGGPVPRVPTLRQAGAALGLSVLGYTGYYLLLVLAIADAGAALPVLIIGTIPLWVMVLGKPRARPAAGTCGAAFFTPWRRWRAGPPSACSTPPGSVVTRR